MPAERWPQLVEAPQRPTRMPTPVADAILACLEREPARRPAPAALADALEPVLAAQPKPKLAGLRPRWR